MLQPIASFEPVVVTVRWPVLVVLELVSVTAGLWAWRSEDGSWWTMRAAKA